MTPKISFLPAIVGAVLVFAAPAFGDPYGQVSPNGPSKITFPVIGGTGIYTNADGCMNFRNLGVRTAEDSRSTSSPGNGPRPASTAIQARPADRAPHAAVG